MMCRVLKVSRSGFYAFQSREPSARELEDAVVVERIKYFHNESRGTYGSPRILEDLKEDGFELGRRRVARLMTENSIFGTAKKKYKVTTDSKHSNKIAANILQRDFGVGKPNMVWASDITAIKTWSGWLYLAVIIDVASRKVVGWSMASHMRTSLALGALKMALGRRLVTTNMLHHSDRGSQYSASDYRQALRNGGIECSMSKKGDCWDNAVVESFFATLKKELIYRHPWPTPDQARAAVAEYIEVFFNRKRRHSTLGYISPVDFESNFELTAAIAA